MIFLYRQKQVSVFLSRPRIITPVAYVFLPQQAKGHHPKFDGGYRLQPRASDIYYYS